ncbi:transposase (plasmid) [Roseomonas sp. CCTCC AB2023176]|uniref:transposase n=1 Tax=Roseomonas sp. CCTCC AB2023176 TaxID=3342640 RepID=UPI0035DDF02F
MSEAVRRRRSFPDEFKLEAVAAIRGGRSVAQVASELGLPDRLVRSWLRWAERQAAGALMFRFAVETEADGSVKRVVFLALCGEEGRVECFWPVPLESGSAEGLRRNSGGALQMPLSAAAKARGGRSGGGKARPGPKPADTLARPHERSS